MGADLRICDKQRRIGIEISVTTLISRTDTIPSTCHYQVGLRAYTNLRELEKEGTRGGPKLDALLHTIRRVERIRLHGSNPTRVRNVTNSGCRARLPTPGWSSLFSMQGKEIPACSTCILEQP